MPTSRSRALLGFLLSLLPWAALVGVTLFAISVLPFSDANMPAASEPPADGGAMTVLESPACAGATDVSGATDAGAPSNGRCPEKQQVAPGVVHATRN